MASIPTNGYAEVMAGTNNYSGSNSFDGSCPRTAIPPVIGDDLCNKTYVDNATGGGIIDTLTDKGSLITGDGTQAVIFDQNPYQTALTTTTVYDWNALANGQSRDFTTTAPTSIPLGASITITYSGTDSITGTVTAVAGSVITITITALASLSYSSGFLLQTSSPDGAGGDYTNATFPFNPAVTTPIPPNIPANTIITDGECYVSTSFATGVPISITANIIGSNIQRPSATPFTTIPFDNPTVNPTFYNFPSGCFVGTTQSPSVQFLGGTYRVGFPSGGTFAPRNYVGSLSGYTVGYSTGSITISGSIALLADPVSTTGLKWGVVSGGGGGGTVNSVSGGTNVIISGSASAPVVNLRNPLTAELNMGSQSLRDSASAVGTSGQLLSAGTGGQTLWTNPPPTNPTITDTNTNATFYPTFVAGSGTQPLLADIATGAISLNPSNGNFNVVDTLKLTQSQLSVGKEAGQTSQGNSSVAVGFRAGQNTQGSSAVAIGANAGITSQSTTAVAVGGSAGATNQGQGAVAIGVNAGNGNQGARSVSIGEGAGQTTQSANGIAIGNTAGQNTQGANAVAVGHLAGQTSQGLRGIAIGFNAGNATQSNDAVAIGHTAGQTTQGTNSVAVGNNSGNNNQGNSAVAIGNNAGQTSQKGGGVAIGSSAGNSNQDFSAVAIGENAGETTQSIGAIAIGVQSGRTTQGVGSIAVGNSAGTTSQGNGAVAIGISAGQTSQGANSIAIGSSAGQTSQTAGSICLNASGAALNPTTAGLYIDPIRNLTGNQNQQLQYNPTTHEVIAFPNSNNVMMEDFDMYDTTATFFGNRLSFLESGAGATTYYSGVYEAGILTGAQYRRGVIQMAAGTANPSSTILLTDLMFSYANISKVSFGIVPHANETLAVVPVAAGNITQSLGIASAASSLGNQTSNTVIWRMTSASATIPSWEFVINNVVQFTLSISPKNMTAKWCRAEINVNYGGGATATVSGTWYNLTDGISETTGTYTITAGTGFPAALTTPNTVGIYMACYSNNATNKYMGVDYVEVQQPNLYPVGSGTTDTTGR